MNYTPLTEYPRAAVDRLLNVIHLFRDIRASGEGQYEVLLLRSRLVNLSPGEALLRTGDLDQWVYFLLRGELRVYLGDGSGNDGRSPVATIHPGEVFGDLAMLLAKPRSATIVASPGAKDIQVLALDCTLFSDLDDFSQLSLATKLVFYRNMKHTLRWKLEVYRSRFPEHDLANSHRRLKLYTGPRNGPEELQALADQARVLASILLEWNAEFGSGQLVMEESDMSDFLDSIRV